MTLPQQPNAAELDHALNEVLDAELETILKNDREDSAKFEKRRRLAKRIQFWAIAIAVVGSLLGMVALYGYFFWKDYITDYDKYGSHTSNCVFKVGERTMTGTRNYSYRYMTVLGYKIYMTPASEIDEETRLDIDGNAMTVLLTETGKETRKEFVANGEKFRKFLPKADSYTFFMDGGKNTAIVSYKDLCK
jgi:hypothetical protein